MTSLEISPHQTKAVSELSNGRILHGGVGSGKSRTAVLYYYTRVLDGRLYISDEDRISPPTKVVNLYIVTTAKKRDDNDWEEELAHFALSTDPTASYNGIRVKIDSWNNIKKYEEVKDAFFIFDEQRLVGSGAWVKSFYKIAKANQWIILSATPGDDWMDYIPVFVANGFYKNKTAFTREHCVYNTWAGYPRVERFVNTRILYEYRRQILVYMPYRKHTKRHIKTRITDHNKDQFERIRKERWNVIEERPIKDAGELFRTMRWVVNQDPSRLKEIGKLLSSHPKLIVFYNFNYELEALRGFAKDYGVTLAEWNGQKHMPIPKADKWLYLVQYTAGSEGWNCTETDAMIFYSLTYSYKQFEQAQGRIDRLNTPFTDLYYYVFRSNSFIDNAIWRALTKKKNFNEREYYEG